MNRSKIMDVAQKTYEAHTALDAAGQELKALDPTF
ncbi:CCE_0567 family metalloprotein [Frankia sp. Cppng1_Ct_nod]|nr:CCE_0567 family metalloprotein [Frankia sp. Cppng1_Ct_nod]